MRRAPPFAVLAASAVIAAACARTPESRVATTHASSRASSTLPPLPEPAPAASESAPPNADERQGDGAPRPDVAIADAPAAAPFNGHDPFAAPPAAPEKLAPPPARPPGTDPSADDRAGYTPYCGRMTECGVCNNAGRCGYCLANHQCVPKDRYGPYPGTCSGGFVPEHCPGSYDFPREEPKIHARMADLLRGMTPFGAPIDTKVDGVSTKVGGLGKIVRTLRIPVARGFCYGLAARESYDLNVSLNAQVAVDATYYEDGGDWVAVYQQSSVLTPFCPQNAGAIVVRMMLDHRDPLPAEAKGTFRVQLLRKPISEAELRARAEKHDTEQRRASLQYVCGHCTQVLLVCRLEGQPRCTDRYLACLKSVNVTPDDCERGDVTAPPKKAPWDT